MSGAQSGLRRLAATGYLLMLLVTSASADPSVRERNWTIQTSIGKFGMASITVGETNRGNPSVQDQYRSLQLYFGPLGTRVFATHTRPGRPSDPALAATLVAIIGVSTVWWLHHRRSKSAP
jgi:hypothetical protein